MIFRKIDSRIFLHIIFLLRKKEVYYMVDIFSRFLEVTNNILWSYILIAMLIGFGLYFSFKLKFVQITHFSEMVGLISKGFNRKKKKER